MKVVILAGGLGTRISEESHLKPKPMIELDGKPILWHIMKEYSHYGFNDFIICCGYKQHIIKEYFSDYYLHNADVTFNLKENTSTIHSSYAEPWTVTLVDTGLNTMTGGRIKRIQKYVGNETFMLTYGDGVCDINISELLKFHHSHNKIATLTAINAGQRFGVLDIENNGCVSAFREKNDDDSSYINGGYMVFNSGIFDYMEDDTTVLEKAPLEALANSGNLVAYKHNGFWQCMDTQRDREKLQEMLLNKTAPWKVW